MPHPPRDDRAFTTASGRAHLPVNPLEWVKTPPGHLILQTLRSHDQYNTTVYGNDDRYRGIHGGRRVVLVNPDDLSGLGFVDGDRVDIVSVDAHGNERRVRDFRIVGYSTPRGNAAAYYPETNPLVPLDHLAKPGSTDDRRSSSGVSVP